MLRILPPIISRVLFLFSALWVCFYTKTFAKNNSYIFMTKTFAKSNSYIFMTVFFYTHLSPLNSIYPDNCSTEQDQLIEM